MSWPPIPLSSLDGERRARPVAGGDLRWPCGYAASGLTEEQGNRGVPIYAE